jgi:nucleotide-binding universal stress UspA family protein
VVVGENKSASDAALAHRRPERERTLEWLTALRDESRADAQVACVEAASVARGLHELVASRHLDLLVIGSSGRDQFGGVFGGDDTRETLEEAPCVVAVAPAGYATYQPVALTKVGVAYDGSAGSARALAMARSLAAEHGSKLSAFQAVGAPHYVHDRWAVQTELNDAVKDSRERVTELGQVEPHAEFGDAVEELTRFGASVDLLVVGSHKHRPIDHLAMRRTTAQRLAADAPCPLLVLGPTERAAAVADE